MGWLTRVLGPTPDLENLAAGLTPVATGWGTAPTDLGNMTDGDFSTVTGTGITQDVVVETEDKNEILVDLGAVYIITHIYLKIGIWETAAVAGQAECKTRLGEIGTVAGDTLKHTAQGTTQSEVISLKGGGDILARYVSMRAYHTTGDADKTRVKFYELLVYGQTTEGGL